MTKLQCPACGADLDVVEEFKNWVDMFGEESEGNALINLACECRDGGFVIDMQPYTETNETDSPIGGVTFPKLDS